MNPLRIATSVGSLRNDSYNSRLARAVERIAGPRLAFEHFRIDDLPLYSQDYDADYPSAAMRLKSGIETARSLLFVTPEYNRSTPGLLRNAIDFGSRPYGSNSFAGKPAAVIGTSPGAIGTALAQQHLRSILGYLDAPVLGQPEVYLRFRDGLIAQDGTVSDVNTPEFLERFTDRYVDRVTRLAA